MTLAAATELHVAERVAAARTAQAAWAEAPAREKRAVLQRLARLVLDRRDEIADVIVSETAKPRVEAFTTELYPALDAVAWLVRNAARVLAPQRVRYR